MDKWLDGEAIVEGKIIREWLKSDEGLVDYSKCEFKNNVSNNDEYIIFDLGEFEHDPDVKQSVYCNGVDLARVAGCLRYDEPYKGMGCVTALNGDDYVRIFMNSFENVTIHDFVLYFCTILDGDIYISETNHHVFVKGRKGTKEELMASAEELNARYIRH